MNARFTAYLREIIAYAQLVEGTVEIDPPTDDDDPRTFISVKRPDGTEVVFWTHSADKHIVCKGCDMTTISALQRYISSLHPYTERVYEQAEAR